jgi:hypothetical protein
VSLTDHDDIEAPMALQVTACRAEVPVSVEWTVPYEHSIFHLGIHNLPADAERAAMSAFAAYTSEPKEGLLPGLLRECATNPDVLIVLNHPYWLEEGVTEPNHRRALSRLLRECIDSIHAFELNGTRVWGENADVISLARENSLPLISGGDRHACEPSACINLTNARTFSEFVSEIREGKSELLFLPQYREPMPLRILEASRDILRPYPEYPGRMFWADRIFYEEEGSAPLPLSAIWKDRVPWFLDSAARTLQFFTTAPFRPALRLLLAQREEVRP